jgi:hypothetical protein
MMCELRVDRPFRYSRLFIRKANSDKRRGADKRVMPIMIAAYPMLPVLLEWFLFMSTYAPHYNYPPHHAISIFSLDENPAEWQD